MFTRIRGLNRRHACPKKKRKTRSDRSNPCPATVTIRLDSEDGVYVPEDEVTGKLILEANTNIKVACLKAGLRGVAKVQWSDVDRFIAYTTYHRATKDYICDYKLILGTDGCTDERKCYHLVRGRHEYRFKFSLPLTGLTTSYEGKHGAVRYWIQAELEAPKYNPFKTKKIFTLINPIDINEQQYQYPVERQAQKNVSCCPVRRGHVTLSARADRNGYCPGESVAITGEFENFTSHAIVPSATLMQKQTYKADGRTKVRTVRLTSITYATIGAGRMTSWDAQPLRVPPIPPSITTCPLIRLEYYVTMTLQVSRRCTLNVDIPLVVGTVPYRLLRISGLPAAPPYSPPANMGCPPPAYSECMSDSEDPEFEPHYTYVRDYAFQSPPRYSEIDPFPNRRPSRKKFESDSESSIDSDSDSAVRSTSNVSTDSGSLRSEKPCSCNMYYSNQPRRSSSVLKKPCTTDNSSLKSDAKTDECICCGEMTWRCCEHGQITEMRTKYECSCRDGELHKNDQDDSTCNCYSYRGRVRPPSACTCTVSETVQFRAEVTRFSLDLSTAADATSYVAQADDTKSGQMMATNIEDPQLKTFNGCALYDVSVPATPTLSDDVSPAEAEQVSTEAHALISSSTGETDPDFIVYQVLDEPKDDIPSKKSKYSTCVQMHRSLPQTTSRYSENTVNTDSCESEIAKITSDASSRGLSEKTESKENTGTLERSSSKEMMNPGCSQAFLGINRNNRVTLNDQEKHRAQLEDDISTENRVESNDDEQDEMG